MQRSASPDITEGPPSEPRRPGRPRKIQPDANNISSTSSVNLESTINKATESPEANTVQPVKRGRGRPKRVSEPVETTTSPQTTPTLPSLPTSTSGAPPQQPKRRGRKPKVALENPELVDTDRQDAGVDDLAMDTTPEMAPSSCIPMDTDEVKLEISGLNFFSSVLKSEPIFGQLGGGIPGLDLDDGEANISTGSSEPLAPVQIPTAMSSFSTCSSIFASASSAGIDEECKNLQQLSITKVDEGAKPPSSSENVKKEEASNEDNDSSKVRRSSRIKTLEEQRGSRGRRREVVSSLSDSSGISRSSLSLHEDDSNSNSSTSMQYSGTSGYSSPSGDGNGLSNSSSTPNLLSLSSSGGNGKPEKLKSRWRYSLDAEKTYPGGDTGHGISESSMPPIVADPIPVNNLVKRKGHLAFDGTDDELQEKLKKFEGIDESIYRTERKVSKENKGMVCDCYLSNEDIDQGDLGCCDDCLNRLLMVECGGRCPTGDNCSNKRFQKKEYASLEVFKTEKKGHGLRTLQYIPEGGFVIEYVGEVLDVTQFEKRTNEYAKGNHEHFYFMALKSDAIIDATLRGNCSRFINHSCEPNCETQKWTVNGELRIGFFAITDLQPGDEITFDYQFQRYGKNAQRCFCGTDSCRGWIGEEDDDEVPEDGDAEEEEKEDEVAPETETAEDRQAVEVKPKVRVERKKRKNVQLEDMAYREELAKLEASGLKNRNHTLTLSRLMVRAESWDDRERLLKILIHGEQPCRRLFLDYHGLRLIWSWMVDLPLPHESEGPQLIRNDVYHMLFLEALKTLPIPNKSLLLESKVLALVEKWCSAPLVTTTVTLVKGAASSSEPKKVEVETSNNAAEAVKIESQVEIMDTSDIKEEPTSTADGMQEIVEEKTWHFVPISKSLLVSWSVLKEVFRIPKKERVEQMKEHEREADKGQVSTNLSSGFSSSSSYDRDHRNKYRNRDERRVPILDSTQPKFHRYQNRQVIPPGVSKEEWRKHFEQSVRQREEQEMLRKQQDALVTLHQERCALVGLDPATTPIVDPHGVHYLDPKTVMWKTIDIEDPSLPPELIKFVQLSQYPPQTESIEAIPAATVDVPVEPEEAFPPWPSGLPPPPPLPPAELPKNWKMAVDDEGRCYYYHIRTRITRWDPPTPEEASSSESSESSSEEEVIEEILQEGSPSISKSKMITKSSKKIEKAARRKKAGLVQERIISPRADDEKGFSKEMVKENKKKVLEEKLAARQAMKEAQHAASREKISTSEEDAAKKEVPVEKTSAGGKSEKSEAAPKKSSSSMKKKRKERQNPSKGSSSSSGAPKPKPTNVKKGEEGENIESSSPIETELDLTLSQQNFEEENDGFFSRVSTGPSRIIGSTPSMDVVMIPGLGFDSRDLDAKKKAADRAARHAAKKKAALAMQKKVKEKAPAEPSTSGGSSGEKRVSSKEASHIKDAFRSNVASVVVAHLNAYRKNEHIKTNDDFKHLARKITHTILLKELKHTRDVTSLEVTDSVKHKTKEYIKKFMGRFPNGVYVRSPENPQAK